MGKHWRFTKENMYTAAGFVLDSFAADQAAFVDVAGNEFDGAFASDAQALRQRLAGATGSALRTGGTGQTTIRLYASLDQLRPLLDKLDIRLGLLGTAGLTVPARKFGLKELRDRLGARDAEAVSRGLTVLTKAVADNLPALQAKGHTPAEQASLAALRTAIDADNAAQNTGLNTSIAATGAEDADYTAVDEMLGRVMRTGRLLYKSDKAKRRQYEVTAVTRRVQAARQGGEGPAA